MIDALHGYRKRVDAEAAATARQRIEEAKKICQEEFGTDSDSLIVTEVAKLIQQTAEWLTDDE